MVCLNRHRVLVMSTAHAREVVSACNRSATKMQRIGELLLLSSDIRPLTVETLSVFGESYNKCRETIVSRTQGLNVLTTAVNLQLHSVTARWHDVAECMREICELVTSLTECCSHAAYLIATSFKDSVCARAGIVDHYRMSRANIDLELCCMRLKQSTTTDLSPPVLVDVCSDISRHLTILTECCRIASEMTANPTDQDQFKLCIKSLTANASCLLASIKCFKSCPTDTHYRRCVEFCEPLMASSTALISFATESEFIGQPAKITSEAQDAQKTVLSKYEGESID